MDFAWQVQHLVLCKGHVLPFCVAGAALLRGRRGTFAWQARHFCVAGAALGVLSLVFAWQVQQVMLCKGPDVRWRPLAS